MRCSLFIYLVTLTLYCTKFKKINCKYLYFSAIQFFNRMWIFVIWLIIFNFLEGFAVNGIASASIPALERQFKLTSSKSSLIPASQDIGAIILILFVSAIGARFNKAAWIAGGSLVMAVGSFVFIIPHIAKKYHYEGEG